MRLRKGDGVKYGMEMHSKCTSQMLLSTLQYGVVCVGWNKRSRPKQTQTLAVRASTRMKRVAMKSEIVQISFISFITYVISFTDCNSLSYGSVVRRNRR